MRRGFVVRSFHGFGGRAAHEKSDASGSVRRLPFSGIRRGPPFNSSIGGCQEAEGRSAELPPPLSGYNNRANFRLKIFENTLHSGFAAAMKSRWTGVREGGNFEAKGAAGQSPTMMDELGRGPEGWSRSIEKPVGPVFGSGFMPLPSAIHVTGADEWTLCLKPVLLNPRFFASRDEL
jgi:hypothetical protein